MTQAAFDQGDWRAVIDAHPLESHDPQEWLRYGVALLQTVEPGPTVGKQQQQAALAFVQAQKEGAAAEQVMAAQRQSVLLSLHEALNLAGLSVPVPTEAHAPAAVAPPQEQLQALTAVLARLFAFEPPKQASVLDQLLAAKEHLRHQQIDAAAVEAALRQEIPTGEPDWNEALQKVLLVLR